MKRGPYKHNGTRIQAFRDIYEKGVWNRGYKNTILKENC